MGVTYNGRKSGMAYFSPPLNGGGEAANNA